VAFGQGGRTLASGDDGGRICLWDMQDPQNPKLLRSLSVPGQNVKVKSVAFSPNGQTLASAGQVGPPQAERAFIRLWEVATGRPLGSAGYLGAVNSVAFNPRSDRLASAGSDIAIGLWDVENPQSPKLIGQLRGHLQGVTSVTFSPDGNLLASAGPDLTIRMWDLQERQQLGPYFIRDREAKTSVAFSPDGKRLAAGGRNGVIYLRDTDVEAWPARARAIAHRNMSWDEWQEFFKERRYHKTFPDLPLDPSVIEGALKGGWDKLREIRARKLSKPDLRSAYEKIIGMTLLTENAGVNNEACWRGSIDGFADLVLPAGERAVELAPNDPRYRDTRGLARALTGDVAGALEDFRFYVDKAKPRDDRAKERLKRRRGWITELEAGRNPFDEATLARLRNE
jgi:hypothetical protein